MTCKDPVKSSPCQQTNTQLFTGRMSFLSLNQQHCFKWSKKEDGSLPQSEVECPSAEIFLSENGEFWCILSGILCDLELQETKQETVIDPANQRVLGLRPGRSGPTLSPD